MVYRPGQLAIIFHGANSLPRPQPVDYQPSSSRGKSSGIVVCCQSRSPQPLELGAAIAHEASVAFECIHALASVFRL